MLGGLLGVVSDARNRDHESMTCATTVSASEQACACHRWKAPDCFDIAADECACFYFTGRVWAVSGGQEL
jgi:hypothetical protein